MAWRLVTSTTGFQADQGRTFPQNPEKISGLCERYLDKNLKTVMDMFETIDLRKGRSDGKLEKRSDNSLRIIKCGDQRVFVVDSYRKDLISAIRDKFGADVEIIPPRAASARLEELSRQPMDGTYLERPRPDVRTIYFQDGEFAPLPLWKAKVWQARRPWDVTVSTKVLESLIKTEPRIFKRPIMTWHIPRIRGWRNW